MPKVLYELVEVHMKDVATVLYELMELPMKIWLLCCMSSWSNVPRVLYGLIELPMKDVATVLCELMDLELSGKMCQWSCMSSWSCL